MRQAWDIGDILEVFCNTHKEWQVGTIQENNYDQLRCGWRRLTGKGYSKQVNRYSNIIRPIQVQSLVYIAMNHRKQNI